MPPRPRTWRTSYPATGGRAGSALSAAASSRRFVVADGAGLYGPVRPGSATVAVGWARPAPTETVEPQAGQQASSGLVGSSSSIEFRQWGQSIRMDSTPPRIAMVGALACRGTTGVQLPGARHLRGQVTAGSDVRPRHALGAAVAADDHGELAFLGGRLIPERHLGPAAPYRDSARAISASGGSSRSEEHT